MASTVRVKGLREFQRSLKTAEKETRKQVRDVLRETGDVVRKEAATTFSVIDAGSASGFKTRVRQRGVAVEQSRRKTTGRRGDYGHMQQETLERALDSKQDEFVKAAEEAVEKLGHMLKGA